ncbi:Fic family protein [Candidatus Dependentiae bacterium]|nr:Fic family protein [Candidatus Dependentiae bacterium]
MNKRFGTYVVQKNSIESFKAFVPQSLPPDPAVDVQRLLPVLDLATRALAELNSVVHAIPNMSLFLYMYVRKEALLSSQIEGTQSSLADLMLFEADQKSDIAFEDVEEVSNYVKATQHGLERMKNGFPLSLRLLREIHAILLSGSRGSGKLPGEFRRSQNWIGGSRPGNARFVPPPPAEMLDCLSDFEKFLHTDTFPVLIKAGLAHVQFETIHPFLDGNGRLGRLLITLLLCADGVITAPVLYLSFYLKEHRREYYDLLQDVRLKGDWEGWLEFFLEGVAVSARQGLETVKDVNELFERDRKAIEKLGRVRFSVIKVFEFLQKLPQVSVSVLGDQLQLTPPTLRVAIEHLKKLGILHEITGKKRDQVYVYRQYLGLLSVGTEPLR